MVDRAAKDQIARLVKDYVLGRVTNQDLDGGLPRCITVDHTASEIVDVLERAYEDVIPFSRPRRINHNGPISRDERRQLARIVMFLRTDLERLELSWWQSPVARNDYWPFATLYEYEQALKQPRLLCGGKNGRFLGTR